MTKKQDGLEYIHEREVKKVIIRAMVIIKKLNRILYSEHGNISIYKFPKDDDFIKRREIKRKANNHMFTIMWGLRNLSASPNEISLAVFEELLDSADVLVKDYFEKNRVNELESLLFLKRNLKIGAKR